MISTVFEALFLIFIKIPCICISEVIRYCFPINQKSVNGEVILITGAGHGIGRSLSLKLAGMGGKMVLWDINKENCDKTRDEIKSHGGVAFSYVCDVTDVDAVRESAERVRKDVGDVTMLINNAGIFNSQSLLNLRVEEVRRCVDINLTSHFWTIKEFLPNMLKWNHGHIVGISSVAGLFAPTNFSDYSASKFGVRGMMWSLDDEINSLHKKDGVKVTVVCPSFVDTGIARTPKMRFPWTSPILSVDEATDEMIEGIRKELSYVYLPKWHTAGFHALIGMLPYKATLAIIMFLGFGAETHER